MPPKRTTSPKRAKSPKRTTSPKRAKSPKRPTSPKRVKSPKPSKRTTSPKRAKSPKPSKRTTSHKKNIYKQYGGVKYSDSNPLLYPNIVSLSANISLSKKRDESTLNIFNNIMTILNDISMKWFNSGCIATFFDLIDDNTIDIEFVLDIGNINTMFKKEYDNKNDRAFGFENTEEIEKPVSREDIYVRFNYSLVKDQNHIINMDNVKFKFNAIDLIQDKEYSLVKKDHIFEYSNDYFNETSKKLLAEDPSILKRMAVLIDPSIYYARPPPPPPPLQRPLQRPPSGTREVLIDPLYTNDGNNGLLDADLN